MAWTYVIRTGHLYYPDGRIAGVGYSGHGAALNNPASIGLHAVGPLPVGNWIVGDAYDHPHLGPCVMNLDAAEGTEDFGRSLFRIHGDNSRHNHTASDGCLIFGPTVRRAVADSEDADLECVAEEKDRTK